MRFGDHAIPILAGLLGDEIGKRKTGDDRKKKTVHSQ
jgi:hypothetical protein